MTKRSKISSSFLKSLVYVAAIFTFTVLIFLIGYILLNIKSIDKLPKQWYDNTWRFVHIRFAEAVNLKAVFLQRKGETP